MSIVDTAKDLYELLSKGATIELQEQLMQLRAEALEIQEENLELRQRVSQLEREANESQEMEFKGEVYWRALTDGDRDGPFCQRCFDVDGRPVRLVSVQTSSRNGPVNKWNCKECNKYYVQ
ncbi:MAG: hypothetical protein AAF351_02000 [Pseudomonadota bacterium]